MRVSLRKLNYIINLLERRLDELNEEYEKQRCKDGDVPPWVKQSEEAKMIDVLLNELDEIFVDVGVMNQPNKKD